MTQHGEPESRTSTAECITIRATPARRTGRTQADVTRTSVARYGFSAWDCREANAGNHRVAWVDLL